MLRFCGQISYSLYLWHWPLFTFARFSKASLVLDLIDKTVLFALTVVISYLSWRFVEQPFREPAACADAPVGVRYRRPRHAGAAGRQRGGIVVSRTSSDSRSRRGRLDAYNSYDYRAALSLSAVALRPPTARSTTPASSLAAGKTNVLLWGDSFAAHYFHGLRKAPIRKLVNILQATQPACMPTLNAAAQGTASCRGFAAQMQAFFADRKPDLVIMSADWLEYARPPRFDGMIADLKETIARLNASGIRVVLLGPAVQFRSRLPSMLVRAHFAPCRCPRRGYRAAGYFCARSG